MGEKEAENISEKNRSGRSAKVGNIREIFEGFDLVIVLARVYELSDLYFSRIEIILIASKLFNSFYVPVPHFCMLFPKLNYY